MKNTSIVSFVLACLIAFGGCAHKEKNDVAGTINGETPSRVLYLPNNEGSWAARWDLISSAKESVDLTYFIIEQDIFGMSLLGLLHHKAKQGVKIRLMVDSRGSFKLSRSGLGADILQEIIATGNGEIRIYNPVEDQLGGALLALDLNKVIASNHDKIVIADKARAIMGGRNISRDYMAPQADHLGAWFDGDLLVEGGAIKKIQKAFDDEYNAHKTMPIAKEFINIKSHSKKLEWNYLVMDTMLKLEKQSEEESQLSPKEQAVLMEGKVIGPLKEVPSDTDRTIIKSLTKDIVQYPTLRGSLPTERNLEEVALSIIDSRSTQNDEEIKRNDINKTLALLLENAKSEVVFATPYLILTENALSILQRAHDRGVELTIYTNSPVSSDSTLSQAMFLRAWPLILEKMPNMKLYVFGERRLMHAKVGSIDGNIAMVGSYNLDVLSAFVNSEILAVAYGKGVAGDVKAQIMNWVNRGTPSTFRYELQRDEKGVAMRDKKGKLIEKFGPRNHVRQNVLEELDRTIAILSSTPAIVKSPIDLVGGIQPLRKQLNEDQVKPVDVQNLKTENPTEDDIDSSDSQDAPKK